MLTASTVVPLRALTAANSTIVVEELANVPAEILLAYAKAELAVAENINVAENIVLPTEGLFGTTIVWTSNNEAVISTAGVVVLPTEKTTVVLTATLSVGETEDTVEFSVVVYPEGTALDQTVTLKYAGATTGNMGDGVNEAAQVGLDATIFSVVGNKNGGGNNIGLNKGGWLAMYYLAGGNGTILTIGVVEGYEIVSIQMTYKMNNTTNPMVVGVNGQAINLASVTEATIGEVIEIGSNEVTIQNQATANTQFHILSMEIVFAQV
jgi:hypothetical protein